MSSEIDEVVENLESVAIVERRTERDENNFKNRRGNQNERRTDLLETQRYSGPSLNKSRHILDLVVAVEKEMSRSPSARERPSCYLQGFDKPVNYCNLLSVSEWLLEKPDDFPENWVMAACPKGTRMLIIAYNGTTKFFDKYGNFVREVSTALPGGNYSDMISNSKSCVLDGFYCKESKIMFVLDMLAFNNHMMSYAEAEARHDMLETKIKNNPELMQYTEKNQIIFKVIPKIPCTTISINEFLSVYPYFERNQPRVDGLLFYHTRAKYFSGETPVVGWLYPYMLPEFLGMDLNVHQLYRLEKPVEYVNYLQFIEKFEARPKRKKQRRVFSSYAVDEEMNNVAAAAVSVNNEIDIAEEQRQDIAAGPWPVDINDTGTAQGQGDNESPAC